HFGITYLQDLRGRLLSGRLGGRKPSKIFSFWPLSATNVADSGQKRFLGAAAPPPTPLRKSYYLESSAAIAIYRSFSVKGLLSKGRPACHKKSRVAALVVSPLMNSSRSASAGAVMRSCS